MDNNCSRPRILFADDEHTTREIYKMCSERAGWQYKVVADGKSAMSELAQQSYDVLITDLVMPELNGLELLKAVRRRDANQAVIVITGRAEPLDLVELLREGAADILQKPVDYESIEQSVRRVLAARREKDCLNHIYRLALYERTVYELTCTDLFNQKFPLPIAERLYRGGKIDLNTKFKLELAFQEALTNSVEHGNLELESAWKEIIDEKGLDRYTLVGRQRMQDPRYSGRKVWVTIEYDRQCLCIVIKDQGTRPWRKTESKGSAQVTQCFGRGLSLIHRIMDQVTFNEDGSEITMVKRLDC